MFPWLWFWAPTLNLPGSGSVTQRIDPDTNWFFDSIAASAGNGVVEKRAFDVASYGRQLGLLTEVLVELADKAPALSPEGATSLERLKQIQAQINQIKADEAGARSRDVAARVRQLKRSDPAEFARLKGLLEPLLLE